MHRSRRIGARAGLVGAVGAALVLSTSAFTAAPVAAGGRHHHHHHDNAFRERILVTDLAPPAGAIQDTDVKNPWGVAFGYAPTATPLWVANNGTGTSTLYSGATHATPAITKVPLTVTTQALPTGVVFNADDDAFKLPDDRAARFIFASMTGEISGWAAPPPPTSTTTMVTEDDAELTGLALAQTSHGPLLFAADEEQGVVHVYDSTWTKVDTISDPGAPEGLVPYNVAVFRHKLYVSMEPGEEESATSEEGPTGAVEVFTLGGHLLRRLVVGHGLDGPWGMAVAPKHWGRFGGDLLVGNEDGGEIHAYDLRTGHWNGTVRDRHGDPIAHDGLWGIQFGNGVIGNRRSLIIVAGINEYADGIVASIRPAHRHHH